MNPSSKVAVTHSLLRWHHVQVSVSFKALSVTFIGLVLSNRWLRISKRSSHAHRRTPDVKCRVREARERGRFTREGIQADPAVPAGESCVLARLCDAGKAARPPSSEEGEDACLAHTFRLFEDL